jgi:hypothetical protein
VLARASGEGNIFKPKQAQVFGLAIGLDLKGYGLLRVVGFLHASLLLSMLIFKTDVKGVNETIGQGIGSHV